MNKEKPKWEKEFDKRTDMPEKYEDIEDSLYDSEKYPESEYGLSLTKLSEFIAESIHQARAEEMARVVDNIRFIYDNYWLDQKIQTSGNYKIVINREMFIKLLFSL